MEYVANPQLPSPLLAQINAILASSDLRFLEKLSKISEPVPVPPNLVASYQTLGADLQNVTLQLPFPTGEDLAYKCKIPHQAKQLFFKLNVIYLITSSLAARS